MTDDEIRNLFEEMRQDPVPADSLVRVRSRLQDRVRRRTAWRVAMFAIPVLAALAIAILLPTSAPVHHVTAPRPVAQSHEMQPSEPSVALAPPQVRPAIQTTRRKAKRQAPEFASIRIETPDPEVVILLVANDRERNR
jgi:hypothetical protein